MKRSVVLTALTALILCAAPNARLCAQQAYTLTDIGPRSAENFGPGIHINASGHIIGYTENAAGNFMPYAWTPASPNAPTGTYAMLPVPNGTTYATATGINGAGQVCGTSVQVVQVVKGGKIKSTTVTSYALLWQPNGALTYLTNGGTTFGGQAYSINDSGEIVGDFGLWVSGTVYALPGRTAMSINKSGQVAGWFDVNNNGYLWTPTQANGTTGSYVTFPFGAAQVNDLGQVVGIWGSGLAGPAALYTPSGGVQYLVPQGTSGLINASGINNLTQVVGLFNSAYLWDSTHGLRYLNDATQFTIVNGAGWNLLQADGINDFGQIVGWGTNLAGAQRFFLLTPQ